MKRSVICASTMMMTLTTGISAASATEFDPNQANRYSHYSVPFRDRGLQSSGVRLEGRNPAPQYRTTITRQGARDYGSPYDRTSGVANGGY